MSFPRISEKADALYIYLRNYPIISASNGVQDIVIKISIHIYIPWPIPIAAPCSDSGRVTYVARISPNLSTLLLTTLFYMHHVGQRRVDIYRRGST